MSHRRYFLPAAVVVLIAALVIFLSIDRGAKMSPASGVAESPPSTNGSPGIIPDMVVAEGISPEEGELPPDNEVRAQMDASIQHSTAIFRQVELENTTFIEEWDTEKVRSKVRPETPAATAWTRRSPGGARSTDPSISHETS